MLHRLAPQPIVDELPRGLVDPADGQQPHPLAIRAAAQLRAWLATARLGDDALATTLGAPGGGKMFGVLVVRDAAGDVGYLQAFSGMLVRRWHVEGFAPPVFDDAARAAVWTSGEAQLAALTQAHAAVQADPAFVALRQAELGWREAQRVRGDGLREGLRQNKAARHARRERLLQAGDASAPEVRQELAQLERQSRADRAARRAFEGAHAAEAATFATAMAAHTAELARLAAARSALSVELTAHIHHTYRFSNALGETRALRELAGASPPAGTGDCAAPKLLMRAHALGATPLALAEFLWGGEPADSGKLAGMYYEPCRAKCGLILPFLLRGLNVLPSVNATTAATTPAAALRVLFEDEWLIAVEKPAGMLSVPGRDEASMAPSAQDWLQAQAHARVAATFPRVVHRLDMDTSGILLAAKDAPTFAAMHRLFAARGVAKKYIAVLDGELEAEDGRIDFPLGPDLDARPRQQWDPAHGKHAVTTWTTLSRGDGQTRVEFSPHTGRTHQLRVHAAHARGLGAPIVGDRLYGRAGGRLLLHAVELQFSHPHTGAAICLRSEPTF
ncbi:MAG: RluA family pseudouridine synthase [Myxococcales bacterium]|nr:RluA family pseudouridine synthase [Myxococcales bacterium]